MFSVRDFLIVSIPALPLLAAIITAVFGKRWLRERSHVPALVALPLAFVLSVALLFDVKERAAEAAPTGAEHVVKLWTWAAVDGAYLQSDAGAAAPVLRNFVVEIVLRSDGLTSIMLSMVLFVSTLVALYAVGYMHGDPGYWRFFTYVSLFVFSMTMLVSVSNFALLYIFWEAVGVCSYLLIGFWFQKPEAAAAGKKAFLVNRVGDFGFALGVFLLWTTYGTLDFHDGASGVAGGVAGILGAERISGAIPYAAGGLGMAICLCLLVGACGKSAQFPLHVWLPDAMEGPTPVSALIHAATMVTAGVYLVARCTPLFAVAPDAQAAVAVIGCATALLAGLIALTQNDLKRVLAYSTVSQLGFMFLGLGTGTAAGIVAGMFHLFTHAFFKALLFLGAGSVMHAMGNVIDMRRFGGLRRIMPWTHWTFWFGSLALAGVVPFAGFWSKDQILAAVHDRLGNDYMLFGGAGGGIPLFHVLYYAALTTAFLTAFYTFRALFMTFYGETRVPAEAGHHAHESPAVMTRPLAILAACALLAGPLVMVFAFDKNFADFLSATPSLALPQFAKEREATHAHGADVVDPHLFIAGLSTVVALSGVGLAAFLYLGDRRQVSAIARFTKSTAGLRVYYLSCGKFFFDQLYGATIVWPLRMLAALAYWIDRWIVDGLVDLVGVLPRVAGAALRPLQVGLVQFYALAMVLGALVLLGIVLR